jgi:hypothetical protein
MPQLWGAAPAGLPRRTESSGERACDPPFRQAKRASSGKGRHVPVIHRDLFRDLFRAVSRESRIGSNVTFCAANRYNFFRRGWR